MRAAMAVKIPEGDAVLRGDDDGVGAEQRLHRLRRRAEGMGLGAEKDDVLDAEIRRVVGGGGTHGVGFVRRLDGEAVRADRGELRAARDERDLGAGCGGGAGHLSADQTADGAGAEDAESHRADSFRCSAASALQGSTDHQRRAAPDGEGSTKMRVSPSIVSCRP